MARSVKDGCCGARRGVVLVELIVVCLIMTLILSMIVLNPVRRIEQNKVDRDLDAFYLLLRTVAESAIMNQNYYEIVINMNDGAYRVFALPRPGPADQEDSPDGAEPPPEPAARPLDLEPVLPPGRLRRNLVTQAEFDDGTRRSGGEIVLKADGQGWIQGVVLQVTDLDETYPRYIRCDRQSARVIRSRKELTLPQPRKKI